MDYKDIEPYMQTRQLLGWTENLWKNQSGELWFVSDKDLHGLYLVNSEFRKEDKMSQCPFLHETEKKNIGDNEIDCGVLRWYIYAHVLPDYNIDDKKMLDIIKSCPSRFYEDQFIIDFAYIKDNYEDIKKLLAKCELSIQDFFRWLYLYIEELNNRSIFTNNSIDYSRIKLIGDNNSSVNYKSNWFFNTWVLFSPTSDSSDEYITAKGYPYTHYLHGIRRCIYSHWSLFDTQARNDVLDSLETAKRVAMWMPAALLAYVADESRKKLLGTEWEWSSGRIDFKSRDFIWAISNMIDVSKLNFRVDGRKLYDAYLKDRFEDAKEQYRLTPSCELMSDDEIWSNIYDVEMKHWKEDQPMKDILPEDIYTEYAEYVEAFFKYFRAIHPCVCEQNETGDDSSNQQTTQPVEKTEDAEHGMQVAHAENIANQPTTIDINGLGFYFKASFKGIGQGNEVNKEKFEKFVQLLNQGRSKKEAARIAYIIYQSDQLIRDKRRPANFNAWHKIFCQLTGYDYTVYRPAQLTITEQLKKEFYMFK